MKKLVLLLILALSFGMCAQENQENTTYYLIRHAEKDRSNPNNNNPELTRKGYFRAETWAKVFEKVPLDAIYSTNYNRTLMTAFHTSQQQQIEISMYDAKDLYSADFQATTRGKTVLVVGHSNTTPAFVNKILGEDRYQTMKDNDNSSLYIVTVTGDSKNVQILTIN